MFTAFFFRLLSVYNRAEIMRKPWFIACLILMHLTATAPCAFAFVKAFQDDDESRQALSKVSVMWTYLFDLLKPIFNLAWSSYFIAVIPRLLTT